jgi:probable selenium-dependent hydroxylase accessory protein YqeC
MKQASSGLWEALDLDGRAGPPVVAIVGGGGKTTLLYGLGHEAVARGRRAILGGTTRFTPAASGRMPPLVMAAESQLVEAARLALEAQPLVVVTPGSEPQERFAALTPATADALARTDGLGLLAVEADGSKMRPFKAPAEHELVVPPSATHVVAVVGADAVGARLDEEHVHRPERVRALLAGSGLDVTRCAPEVIARVLLHPEGGRRGVDGRPFAVLVNKADAHPREAAELARELVAAGAPRVVVASLRDAAAPARKVLVAAAGVDGRV